MTSHHSATGHWIKSPPTNCILRVPNSSPLSFLTKHVFRRGLNLVTQFHHTLSSDLQELSLSNVSCSPSDLSTLTTCSSQLAALGSIWLSCRHTPFCFVRAQEKLIAKTVKRNLKQSPAALAAPMSIAASTAPFSSPAPPVVCSVPSSHLADDISALTRSFVSPGEQMLPHCQPGPAEAPLTFSPDPAT